MNILQLLVIVSTCIVGLALAEESKDEETKLIGELKQLLERDLKEKRRTTNKALAERRKIRLTVCPAPDTVYETTRSEKTCRRTRSIKNGCEQGERCCDWFGKKHCLKAVSTKPRPGVCPALTMWNDMCIGGYTGCNYDDECHGEDEKCCMDPNCNYKKCLSVRQNIACPQPKTWFPTNRTEVSCTKDTECGLDERCCDWHGSKHCLTGISTIQKHGICPFQQQAEDIPCLADYVGCEWDSECDSRGVNFKCCYNSKCRYGECKNMNQDFSCPAYDTESAADNPFTGSSDCKVDDKMACPGFGRLCCQTGLTTDGAAINSCTDGIIHTPKPGTCPPAHLLADPFGECLEEYEGGCDFDNECAGPTRKCCETACGYNECVDLGPPTHQIDHAAPPAVHNILLNDAPVQDSATAEHPVAVALSSHVKPPSHLNADVAPPPLNHEQMQNDAVSENEQPVAVALSSHVAPPPGWDSSSQNNPLKGLLKEILSNKR